MVSCSVNTCVLLGCFCDYLLEENYFQISKKPSPQNLLEEKPVLTSTSIFQPRSSAIDFNFPFTGSIRDTPEPRKQVPTAQAGIVGEERIMKMKHVPLMEKIRLTTSNV